MLKKKFSFNLKEKGLKVKYNCNISRDKLLKLKTKNHAFILIVNFSRYIANLFLQK